MVAVPKGRDTLRVVSDPRFVPATYDEVLARPRLFPDGRAADLIHAWTPREAVRRFILEYQRRAPTRVLIHLEDNEDFLIETFSGKSTAELRELPELAAGGLDKIGISQVLDDGLVNPVRYRNLLNLADGITLITESLRRWVPPQVPARVIPPGVDFSMYHPQEADPALRSELGLREGEKVIVFTGSNTFANEPEMRDLYLAVKLLNQQGTPTRLVRTGFTSPHFKSSLGFDWEKCVIDLGFVKKNRLPKLLAMADVLVQPGRAGAFQRLSPAVQDSRVPRHGEAGDRAQGEPRGAFAGRAGGPHPRDRDARGDRRGLFAGLPRTRPRRAAFPPCAGLCPRAFRHRGQHGKTGRRLCRAR